MIVNLSFNGIIYTLNLLNVDIWTHQATMSDAAMKDFIEKVLHNNPDLMK